MSVFLSREYFVLEKLQWYQRRYSSLEVRKICWNNETLSKLQYMFQCSHEARKKYYAWGPKHKIQRYSGAIATLNKLCFECFREILNTLRRNYYVETTVSAYWKLRPHFYDVVSPNCVTWISHCHPEPGHLTKRLPCRQCEKVLTSLRMITPNTLQVPLVKI